MSMFALIWMLSALSAALFLIAFLWAWRGRYLLLLQGGSSLGQAAWQAWEAPFSRVLNLCLSLPFVHEWPERLWGSYAKEVRGLLSKRVALTALLTSLVSAFLLTQGTSLMELAGLALIGFFLSVLQAISQGRKLQRQHHSRCRRDLPFFLDLLVLAVESGLGVQQAWTGATQALPQGSLLNSLNKVQGEVRAGRRLPQAMRNVALSFRQAELEELALSLELAQDTGLSLALLLRAQAEKLRSHLHLEAEQRALKLPVYLLAPLVVCIFPCTFLVIAMSLLGPWLAG
ncbi:type II secretion system protein F [Alcaligenes faecalis]|nr:type II secretion system protein F [Alcaligenes faecalis]OSZ53014.1 type II secretion system protein F [Alcaligenes faecalis]OSZ54625.1 type II secretion system protein F [Alcaligenes faecalis]